VIPKVLAVVISSILVTVVWGCTNPPQPRIDAMATGWCDTTPMKPQGRVVRLPNAPVLNSSFGSVVGVVSEAETSDALPSSGVALVSLANGTGRSQPERASDAGGGFVFDSVVPGGYQVRVRSLGHIHQEAAIAVTANRVDTVRMKLPADRCYGY
jgi:hypothetical protein